MDQTHLGKIQCFDVNNQCIFGEDTAINLINDLKLETAFEDACAKKNGKIIRCCPLALINTPYHPTSTENPIHVKMVHAGQYATCPETITSQCVRETDPQARNLCIAQKCNDNGYLEASNYYELCKSYRMGSETDGAPDCPIRNCPDMMTMPDLTTGTTAAAAAAACPTIVPPQPPIKDTGFTLRKFWDSLPTSNNFYNLGSLIMGIIAIILIYFIFFVIPKGVLQLSIENNPITASTFKRGMSLF